MNRNYFFWVVILAAACFALIISSMRQEKDEASEPLIPSNPAVSPFNGSIVGLGLVEPSSENIYIGSPINRIVAKIPVKVGESIKKGDILFELENSDLKAELKTQKLAYEVAALKLQKLKEEPRKEDIIPAEATLKMAEVDLQQAKTQYDAVKDLPDARAISLEEANRRKSNFSEAEAKLSQAKANLDKLKAGAWKPDLDIAEKELAQAKANVERIETEIGRTVIKSPIDGSVLQIKVHEGELTPSDSAKNPIMILGNLDHLDLRVNINEYDLPRFDKDSTAIAYLTGNKEYEFPLEFLRLEPVLVEKNNLTNDIKERVDTRVFQVIYRIKESKIPLFVNQEMEVFIENKA